MADRALIEAKKAEYGTQIHIWGRSGDGALRDLQGQLGTTLNDQVAEFVRTVGNIYIDAFEIVLSGDDQGLMSALAQTRLAAKRCPLPPNLLMISDNGSGTNYFLDLATGDVISYDSFYVIPGQEIRRFKDFDEFVNWVFDQAKPAEEWGRKHWPEGHKKPNHSPAEGTVGPDQMPIHPEVEQQFKELEQQFERLAELLPPDEKPPHQQT
jgi:hypothetical protein